MYSGIITNVLNILFNYIFIYGGFGIKPMGLAGAGLGSSLATVADGIFYLLISNRSYYKSKFQILSNFTFDKEIVKDILKISIPVSFQNIFILIGFLSFIAITGLIGVKEQAASQTVVSALFISLMPCFGFGIAVQTLVGNALGEGDNRKAKHLGNETVKLATMYTSAVAVLFILFPSAVILIFTTDRTLIETAAPLLQIAGGGQILYAAGVVLANGLQSAGKSLFVMLVDILVNWIVFIPLAYLLAIPLGFGIYGAWFAVPIYVFLYSASIFLKFNFGEWFTEKFRV